MAKKLKPAKPTLTTSGMKISKEKLRELVQKEVEAILLARDQNGVLKDEVDFLAGAITVLAWINHKLYDVPFDDKMAIVPPMWMLYPIAGRSVVEELRDNS